MGDEQIENIKIRLTILFEYYLRICGLSKNPEMHFFNIPELKEIDNNLIGSNAIYLIDESFVRGGVDVERGNTFPWITRILPKGATFVEQTIMQTLKITEAKDKKSIQDTVSEYVANNMKNKISDNVFAIAEKLF